MSLAFVRPWRRCSVHHRDTRRRRTTATGALSIREGVSIDQMKGIDAIFPAMHIVSRGGLGVLRLGLMGSRHAFSAIYSLECSFIFHLRSKAVAVRPHTC